MACKSADHDELVGRCRLHTRNQLRFELERLAPFVAAKVLLDSGPLIALFAVDDKHHRRFDERVTSLSRDGLRLLTTWLCIVEASYLLATPQHHEMLHWVELAAPLCIPSGPYDLGDMINWLRQYSKKTKREMDLADASLYWLASETGVTSILTTDVADFSRYRLPDGRPFSPLE